MYSVVKKLHIVTNDEILQRADFADLATRMLEDARVSLHLRAQKTSAAELFNLATRIQAPGLIINDRLDIALAAGIRGFHVGARGLPVKTARELAPNCLLGYSAHSAAEAREAQDDGADFIFAGTIFPSASHPGSAAGGIELLRQITGACTIPVLAIGGVTLEKVAELRQVGVYGVAVISAVWDASDPVHAAREFARILES